MPEGLQAPEPRAAPVSLDLAAKELGRANVRALAAAAEGRTEGLRAFRHRGMPPGALRYVRNVLAGRRAGIRAPASLSPAARSILDRTFFNG